MEMDEETSPESMHSDTSQLSKKPSRRLKKWAPKTRTGCLTCRARRVKCDERRPRCYRCHTKNRDCQYESASRIKPMFRRQTLGDTDNDVESSSGPMILSLTPTYGDSESLRYLDVYRSLVAPWLDRFSRADFFDGMLPRLSWYHPALRHALVAVSMASEQYYSGSAVTKPYRRMWHYQQALKHLYTDDQVQEDVMLSACIMFWVHDNLMGDTCNSMVHLRAMLRLVEGSQASSVAPSSSISLPQLTIIRSLVYWGHTVADPTIINGMDTETWSNTRSRFKDPNYSSRFSCTNNIKEESMLCITAIRRAPDSIKPGQSTLSALTTYDDLTSFVRKWYAACTSSEKPLSYNDRTVLECQHTLLRIIIAIRRKFLSGGIPDLSDDLVDSERLHFILHKLESIDFDKLHRDVDSDDLVVPLLPILAEVGRLAPEITILLRASALLSKMSRVEGVWKSDDVAALLNTMMRTQRRGQQRLPADKVSLVADAMGLRSSTRRSTASATCFKS